MPITRLSVSIAIAILYMVIATGFVRDDRKSHTGGFINLQGMMSSIVTMPVAFALEYAGHKIDFRSNWQMGAAIALCGGLVFALTFGVTQSRCLPISSRSKPTLNLTE
ncbi:MAG: hypothetical protein WDN00_02935 [Limisphaerales bacterium]